MKQYQNGRSSLRDKVKKKILIHDRSIVCECLTVWYNMNVSINKKKHTFHGDIIGNNVWLLLFIYLVYLCIFSRVPKCCRFTFCVCMVYFQYCEQYTIIITLSLLLLLLILLFFSLFLLSAWKHVQNDLWVLTDNDNII